MEEKSADVNIAVTATMIKMLGIHIGSGLIAVGLIFLVLGIDPQSRYPVCTVIGGLFIIFGIIFIYLAVWYNRKLKGLK